MGVIFKILSFFIKIFNVLYLRKIIKQLSKENPANKTHDWVFGSEVHGLLKYDDAVLIRCRKCDMVAPNIKMLPCDTILKRKAHGPFNVKGHDCVSYNGKWICKRCDLYFIINCDGYWVAYKTGYDATVSEGLIPECSEVVMEKVLR